MSRDDVRRFVVAYDIPDDRRRTRIANFLQAYGDRVQYSVFVVDGGPARLVRMEAGLEERIKEGQDSILICDLGPLVRAQSRFRYLGLGRPITDDESFLL